MFLFFPVVCPFCNQKLFFYKQSPNNQVYGIVDQLDSKMKYHYCLAIEGENYWSQIDLQKYLKLDFQDLIAATKDYSYLEAEKKQTKPENGILLDVIKDKQIQKLLLLSSDSNLFEISITSKVNFNLGAILKIKTFAKTKKNKSKIDEVIELKTTEASIDKKYIESNIFSYYLKSDDLNLLEKFELNICQNLQKDQELLAVYLSPYKSKHTRIITFFVKNKNSFIFFLENLVLPSKIQFYLQAEEFQIK